MDVATVIVVGIVVGEVPSVGVGLDVGALVGTVVAPAAGTLVGLGRLTVGDGAVGETVGGLAQPTRVTRATMGTRKRESVRKGICG